MSARAREGKRNETRARRREAKRARESRDAIDDEVSSRCVASRIARSLHTFCKSSCIDRSIRRRSRASLARPSRAEFLTETRARRVAVGRARRMRARAPAHVFDRAFYAKIAGVSFIVGAAFEGFMLATDFLSQSLSNRSRASTRGGKDARRVSANAWRARRGERPFRNCL